jgi:hypothetical protein
MDHESGQEPLEYGNPWFITSTGLVDFVIFEDKLDHLHGYLELLAERIEREHDDYQEAYERGEYRVPGWETESELSAQRDLDMVGGSFPLFLYGSIVALSLALLESLLKELGRWIGRESHKEFTHVERSRRGAFLEGALRFLRQECGVPVMVDSQTWQALLVVRRARNQFIHAIGEDLPTDLRVRMYKALGLNGESGPTFTRETTEGALEVIAAVAADVEMGVGQWLEQHKQR